jgi:hypothetical protein
MTHPTPHPPDLGPLRCDAAEITAMLAAAAVPGSHLLVDREPDDLSGSIGFMTAGLWSCSVWRDAPGWLDFVMHAQAPDGRRWSHGCQRQWETTGAVVEPLDGLSDRQRVALEHRLVMAAVMPQQDAPTGQAVMTLQAPAEEPKRRPMRRAKR